MNQLLSRVLWKDQIIEKTFSMLELWEKSKVYGSDDTRNQRGEAVMELFQILKKYDEGRYLLHIISFCLLHFFWCLMWRFIINCH